MSDSAVLASGTHEILSMTRASIAMTWPEVIELSFKGLTAIAAFLGGLAAWRGVKTWRKQLVGQDEYNLAKRLIKCAIELERSVRRIRNPGNSPEQTWPEFDRVGTEMELALLEAEVHWGNLLLEARKGILACTNELRMQRERLESLSNGSDGPGCAEIRRQANSILWFNLAEPHDDFANKLHEAVEALTHILRRFLKK